MILAINSGLVQAALTDDQTVAPDAYPGCTVIYYAGTAKVGDPDPRAPSDQLAVAIADKLAEVDAWYTSQIANGITVGTLVLPASIDDQTRYTSLGAMQHLAQSLGQIQLTDMSGLTDHTGDWQPMTVQQLFSTLLSYGSQLLALTQKVAAYQAQINAATTAAEVNAIAIT